MRHKLLQIAPVLALIALSGCANGLTPSARTKVNPSSDFLLGVAKEIKDNKVPEHTEQVVDDWIAQNEPREK